MTVPEDPRKMATGAPYFRYPSVTLLACLRDPATRATPAYTYTLGVHPTPYTLHLTRSCFFGQVPYTG